MSHLYTYSQIPLINHNNNICVLLLVYELYYLSDNDNV